MYFTNSIKYLSIKYSSQDSKLKMGILDITKTAILNTNILNTLEYLNKKQVYFNYAIKIIKVPILLF